EPHAERAKEDCREELALANAYVKQVLLIVFELNPRTTIRNDLRNEQLAALEEHAGRTMKLRNNHALSSVDDKRAVVSHQRDLAKEDFLFLDVADRFDVCVGIFIENREANLHLQRHAVTHAAFLAFLLIMLVLQTNRLSAVRAQFGTH